MVVPQAGFRSPLVAQAPIANLADVPEAAQVYNCNGVTKGKLAAAVKAGKRSGMSVRLWRIRIRP